MKDSPIYVNQIRIVGYLTEDDSILRFEIDSEGYSDLEYDNNKFLEAVEHLLSEALDAEFIQSTETHPSIFPDDFLPEGADREN